MRLLSIVCALWLSGSAAAAEAPDLRAQVMQAENAFAKTLADRDHAAFTRMLADEAVFFGRDGARHGAAAVAASWKPLFEGAQAPFSWRAETVEVLASGTLALSSGPVLDPSGKQFGVFNSIWRREPDGTWRVVFDKGCDVCEPK